MALEIPLSEVDICNLALDHLKQAPISQIDPATTHVEERCARWYQQERRANLRIHPWNFAMKRIQITPSGDYTPEFGFTHAYAKPSDFVRLIGFYDDLGSRLTEVDYDLEGDYILRNGTDGAAINVRYVSDVTDVSKFDPLFIDLFAVNLAIKLSPNFSGSEARVKSLVELRKDILSNATAIDGQERPPRRIQTSKFIQSRKRGSNVAGRYTRFSDG